MTDSPIHPQLISRTMEKFESQVDFMGWDLGFLPVVVCMFYLLPGDEEAADLPPRMLIAYRFEPFPVQPGELGEEFQMDLGDAMLMIGESVEALGDKGEAMFEGDAATRFAGLGFLSEGWAANPAEVDKYPPGTAAADMLGSKEIRMFQLLDIEGNYYMLSRIRGEKVQKVQVSGTEALAGEKVHKISGRFPYALRQILLGLSRSEGDLWMNVEAIKAVVPDPE